MKSGRQKAVVRWLLVVVTLVLAATKLPGAAPMSLSVQTVVMVVAVAALLNLGLPMTYGTSTFLPAIALITYLSLGFLPSLFALVVGLVIGGGAGWALENRKSESPRLWWVSLADAAWPVAAHGLSLLLADFAYLGLGAVPPLTQVNTPETLLPVVAAAVLYLVAYNVLLALDAWLAGQNVLEFFTGNRQVLLAVQLLPLPLAPVTAVALASLGLPAFLVLVATLLAIAIAVNRLVRTQGSLQSQVRRLSSFSSVSRALRASLELNELLDTIYLQVAHLLDIDNFYVVLLDADANQLHFPFVMRDGRREARPWHERGNTFIEWVIDERQSLLVSDNVDTVAERMGLNPPESGLRSWMGVPLLASDRTVGCMAAYTVGGSERTFSEEDLELFGNVAVQSGVAVENALLYQDAQQHARQLATLNEISTMINASLDPDQVLNVVSSSIIQVADCDKAAMYLLEDGNQTLRLAHSEGFGESHRSLSQTLSVPLTDEERDAVMMTGKVIAVPDIRSSTEVSPGLVALAETQNFRAYANFPLRAHGRPIGLLAVYYDATHQFQEAELELLQTFANQAALAVANARQYAVTDRALSRRVDQIMVLADINRRLSATLDLDRIFHLVVDAAMEACNALAGMLVVADEVDGSLRIGSWRGYPKDVIQRLERSGKPVSQGIANRVLKSGETAMVTDVGLDPDYVNMGVNTASLLSVPVMLEDKVIGVITLESDEEDAFTNEDVAFVSQLTNQAGIAIKNAQLYRRLGEANDRLHAILDAGTDGLLMLDTQCRIVMTNTSMESFWDFARSDFKEPTVDEFVADPLSALGEGLGYAEGELNKLITRAVRDPEMLEQHDLYVTTGPKQRFVERSASPVRDEMGKAIGMLFVFRDVTEQKELEEARENLANMIVHDLRNPLTAVLASLALVSNAVVGEDDTGVAGQAIEVSGRAVRKLLVMVNNLLDLGRLETGEFTPDKKPSSLKTVVENALGETLPLAMEMEVMISLDSESLDKLPDVHIDSDMIERVVLNLLDNALKFTPPGGEVKVKTALVEAGDGDGEEDGAKSGPAIRVEIIDSGPGVPDDYKTRIFDRFTQVHGQKGRRRGTGLGLAFCRLAVDTHGGRIWVEDAEGEKGSVFAFTLPVYTGALLTD